MTNRKKAYMWVRSHDVETLVADVPPGSFEGALFSGFTWFRIGRFYSGSAVIRGLEFGPIVMSSGSRLLPLSDEQIREGIESLSRVYERRERGTWKIRKGLFCYRFRFRKILPVDTKGREVVKLNVVTAGPFAFSWSFDKVYRSQIKELIEGLRNLESLAE